MVNHGATLEERDRHGATPFLIAASAAGDSLEIARELISLGANPNAVDSAGSGIKYYATSRRFATQWEKLNGLMELQRDTQAKSAATDLHWNHSLNSLSDF